MVFMKLQAPPEEHDSPTEVTGGTTLGQALDMGIPEDILKQYVGDISDKNALIKERVSDLGFSFGDTRADLNEHVKKE